MFFILPERTAYDTFSSINAQNKKIVIDIFRKDSNF